MPTNDSKYTDDARIVGEENQGSDSTPVLSLRIFVKPLLIAVVDQEVQSIASQHKPKVHSDWSYEILAKQTALTICPRSDQLLSYS